MAIGDIGHGSFDNILKLDSSLGALNGTLIDNLKNLVATGHAEEAQGIALGAIDKASKGAQQTVGFFGTLGQDIKGLASDIFTATGGFLTDLTGYGQSLGDQYDAAAKKLKALQDLQARSGSGGGLLGKSIDQQQAQVDALGKQLTANGAQQAAAAQNQLSKEALAATNSFAAEYDQLSKLSIALANIKAAPAGVSGDPEARAAAENRLRTAIQNRINADGSAITIEQQQAAVFSAQIQSINARTNAERVAAAASMASSQAIFTNTDRNVAADRARQLVQAQLSAAAERQLTAIQDQLPVVQALTAADKMRAQEQANYNALINAGIDDANGLASAISSGQLALQQAAATTAVEQQTQEIERQIELIKARNDGTEASVAAEQAYERAIESGADAMAASALRAATLEKYNTQSGPSFGGAPDNPNIYGATNTHNALGTGGGTIIPNANYSPWQLAMMEKRSKDVPAFADGGVMSKYGPVPLRKYADGGVASTPQMALFGEGSGPEAYVPLKGGAIPVSLRGGAQSQTPVQAAIGSKGGVNIGNIIFQGGMPPDTRSRAQVRRAVGQMFR
jgi:hypothetical protein